MRYQLKPKYQITEDERHRFNEIAMDFVANDSELLRSGKRIGRKLAGEIEAAYYKYLAGVTVGWGREILDVELEDLKHDSICKDNHNKKHWVMSYMLVWLADLKPEATADDFYTALTTREAHRVLMEKAYEPVK